MKLSIRYSLVLVISFLLSSCSTLKTKLETSTNEITREVIIVYIRADWSAMSKKIDPYIKKAESYFIIKDEVRYLTFDLTNAKTITRSHRQAKIHGLGESFSYEKHTGEVLFFDRDTKKLLTRVYGVADAQTYRDITYKLLQGQEVADIVPQKQTQTLPAIKPINSSKAQLYLVYVHNDLASSSEKSTKLYKKLVKKYKRKDEVYTASFNLSNDTQVLASERLAMALGIKPIFDSHKRGGEFLFVDAKSKRILASKVNDFDDDEYYKLVKKLRKQIKSSRN